MTDASDDVVDADVSSGEDSAEDVVDDDNGSDSNDDNSDLNDNDSDSNDNDSDSSDQEKSKPVPAAESFSTALHAILHSRVKAHDRSDPILIRSRKAMKELEESRLDHKARKALAAERKAIKNKDWLSNPLPQDAGQMRQAVEYEKSLRKVAQRGVVQLFNAVLHSQTRAATGDATATSRDKHTARVNEMSRDEFLDCIRRAS